MNVLENVLWLNSMSINGLRCVVFTAEHRSGTKPVLQNLLVLSIKEEGKRTRDLDDRENAFWSLFSMFTSLFSCREHSKPSIHAEASELAST